MSSTGGMFVAQQFPKEKNLRMFRSKIVAISVRDALSSGSGSDCKCL